MPNYTKQGKILVKLTPKQRDFLKKFSNPKLILLDELMRITYVIPKGTHRLELDLDEPNTTIKGQGNTAKLHETR